MAQGSQVEPAAIPAPTLATTNPLTSSSSTTNPATAGIEALADATQLLRPSSPLKRFRESEEAAPAVGGPGSAVLQSQSPVSPKSLFASAPPQLTAVAERAEKEAKRRKLANLNKDTSKATSENPGARAIAMLMGDQPPMSRPEDAPAGASRPRPEPMTGVAMTAPTTNAAPTQTRPTSAASGVATTAEQANRSSLTDNAVGGPVSSPGALPEDDGHAGPRENGQTDRLYVNEPASTRALTYPGPLSNAQIEQARARNHSLDSGMTRSETKSPASNKKHKCPYCATEFTRHHNLKSHLLTHSHEKPYLCHDCDSRFRRLHDLKRHSKLHTGERPHVCPICRRSFARGDALARHNKGQGGCAGRRSSVGSYNGEGSEEQMDGMIYTGDVAQEPEHMDDETDGPSPRSPRSRRSSNIPSIRHPDATRGESMYAQQQQRQPSTYPPVASTSSRTPGAGPMGSSLYPPSTPHVGVSSGPPQSPVREHPLSYAAAGGNGPYGVHPMTESPKPLSPGQHPHTDARNRSPSLSHQLNPNQFARHAPPGPPGPAGGRDNLPPPTLPPPPGMSLGHAPPDRYSIASSSGPGVSGTSSSYPPPQAGSYPGGGPVGSGSTGGGAGGLHNSASNSLSSHGTGIGTGGTGGTGVGSDERDRLPYNNEDRLWAVIRNLEAKVDRLEAEVTGLRTLLHGSPGFAGGR